MPEQKEDVVAFRRSAYNTMKPWWTICEDVDAGTERLRDRGTTYLPMAPQEKQAEYDARLAKSEFFNGFERTVNGLTGMIFRRDPVVTLPDEQMTDWKNIDGAGNHGAVFSKELTRTAMVKGFSAILVDFPTVPNASQLNKAEEESMGLRPYWRMVEADRILSLRTKSMNGKQVLEQIIFEWKSTEADGAFGEKEVVRYRQLFLGMTRPEDGSEPEPGVFFRIWIETKAANSEETTYVVESSGQIKNQTEIPVAFMYSGKKLGVGFAKPPLLDLGYTNIAHWQVQSDHRHSLHIASVPILVFIGREMGPDDDEGSPLQVVGPNVGIDVPMDGDVKYVEHAGKALAETRSELRDLEMRMAAQGLAQLQRDTRAAETAEAKRIDASEQDSALASTARSLSDALKTAWGFHMKYKNDGDSTIELEVNDDFRELMFDPTMVTALSTLELSGQISKETLWEQLQSGNILPDTFDADVEKLKLVAMAKDMVGAGIGDAEA